MRVLMIGRSYPESKTGMMGIFEFEQATALKKGGAEMVYLFCDTRSVKSLRKYGYTSLIKNNVPVYGFHLPIGGIFKGLFDRIKKAYFERALKKAIEKEGIPDIIHIHFPLLAINEGILTLLQEYNRPLVATEHWSRIQTKELSKPQEEFLKRIVEETQAFICVGDPLKQSVMELTQTKKDIYVVPNIVSPVFSYQGEKPSSQAFNFVTIGRLIGTKRINLLIDAFTKAFRNDPKVSLTIVGGGPLLRRYKRQIKRLGMEDRIFTPGYLSSQDSARAINNSHAYVSASILETFGVPFIEAMACGKPVIGVRGGALDEYIDSSMGILVEGDNEEDLVEALKMMREDWESYDGKKISETAIEYFGAETVSRQIIDIYKSCL